MRHCNAATLYVTIYSTQWSLRFIVIIIIIIISSSSSTITIIIIIIQHL